MVSTAATEGSSYEAIHHWCLNAQESYEKTPTSAPKSVFVNRAQNIYEILLVLPLCIVTANLPLQRGTTG